MRQKILLWLSGTALLLCAACAAPSQTTGPTPTRSPESTAVVTVPPGEESVTTQPSGDLGAAQPGIDPGTTQNPAEGPGTTQPIRTTVEPPITAKTAKPLPATTPTTAVEHPQTTPSALPAVRGFNPYLLEAYPKDCLARAGAWGGWPGVVDALSARQLVLTPQILGVTAEQLMLLAETFRTHHVLGAMIKNVEPQGQNVKVDYRFDEAEHQRLTAEFTLKVNALLAQIAPPGANALDCVFGSYHAVLGRGRYDDDHLYTTTFDLLMFDKSICYGYAGAFAFLLEQCGLSPIRVYGHTASRNEEHGWVMLDLDGQMYHFDIMFQQGSLDLRYFAMDDTRRQRADTKPAVTYGGLPPWPAEKAPKASGSAFETLRDRVLTWHPDPANHVVTFVSKKDGKTYRFDTATGDIGT